MKWIIPGWLQLVLVCTEQEQQTLNTDIDTFRWFSPTCFRMFNCSCLQRQSHPTSDVHAGTQSGGQDNNWPTTKAMWVGLILKTSCSACANIYVFQDYLTSNDWVHREYWTQHAMHICFNQTPHLKAQHESRQYWIKKTSKTVGNAKKKETW